MLRAAPPHRDASSASEYAGEITLVGAEPLHPYERPPLSKAGSADASDPKFIAAAEKYIENGIRLLTGLEAGDL
ncbi:hypothetical protein ACC731_38365, partial [Rhizobium ruizarguesonis]